MKLLIIAVGGAIGTVFRYLLSGVVQRFAGPSFPFGTMSINLTGCFLAGFLWEVFDRAAVSPTARLFVFIGFLGGYTTFSSFGLETFNLVRDGEYKLALYNVLVSNILGIALVFLGFFASRNLGAFFRQELQ